MTRMTRPVSPQRQTRAKTKTTKTSARPNRPPRTAELREQILADFSVLKVPLSAAEFDAAVAAAERERLAPLAFVARLIAPPARLRRERSIERRIRDAHFHEAKTLEAFDWSFNAAALERAEIEQLATGEFLRRGDNLVLVGQSGVGKSHILQGLGRRFCALGYRVRYATSAELLRDLTRAIASK